MSDAARSSHVRVLVVGVATPMETFLDRLLAGLADNGVSLSLLSRTPPPAGWLDAHGATWHFGPSTDARAVARHAARNGARTTIRAARQLAGRLATRSARLTDHVDAIGPDVIYAPWINTLVDHGALLECGVPVVTSCRGRMITIEPWTKPGHAAALARVFASVARVHCVSRAIEADAVALGLDPTISTVITPAVDPASFDPSARRDVPGPTRVVAVGSLIWRKDYEHALLALRAAVDLGADVELTIVGDGPDRERLVYTAVDLGLRERVRLAGRQSVAGVVQHLRDADVFLHSSSSEGISNAVLEAMAMRLPVVTTDCGGMGEAVRDGVDGFVVGVRDATAMGAALARLASDPGLAGTLGASGRARVEESFRLDQQIAAFTNLLEDAVGTRR